MAPDNLLQQAQGKLSPLAYAAVARWLEEQQYTDYRAELVALIQQEQWATLEDGFFKVVPFGTGGRRGKVGIGPNRINKVTIGQSAQGLANYLLKKNKTAKQQGIVVAYDTRLTSVEFAQLTATIFAANDFRTYLFDSFRPTPELSFAVRHLKTAAGVVISASHNPPTDNGFKVYWQDGGQVVPPHDSGIMEEVAQVTTVNTTDFAAAVSAGKVVTVGAEIDEAYTAAIVAESLVSTRSADIVYSPLHGSGITSVVPALKRAGFTQVTVVAEQATPDGNFPNIKNQTPNPEVRETNAQATHIAQARRADLAITTDPDADRLGVVARDRHGEYQFLTGNQIAALIGHFVLDQLKQRGQLTPRHFVVKTIVTTDFLNAFATDFGVKIYDNILIGFKYIAELIQQYEGRAEFLFGGEESHGILKGSYTRDKDAAIAALLISELASLLKDQGKTLIDHLDALYRQYGIFWETLENIVYEGAHGNTTMEQLMTGLRAQPPTTLAGKRVVRVVDRLSPDSEGAHGDVLIYYLSTDQHTRLTVRPSGTEPKLKIYAQAHYPITPDISDGDLAHAKTTAAADAARLTSALIDYAATILAPAKKPGG
ncbi:MAG: phospho-sugar mutase [Candidatus Andersenbacteria bacterium]